MKNKRKVPKEEFLNFLDLLGNFDALYEQACKFEKEYQRKHNNSYPRYFTKKIEDYPEYFLNRFFKVYVKNNELRHYLLEYYEPDEELKPWERIY